MILNESLFEQYNDIVDSNDELDWVVVDYKQVPDSDGFMTDYVWYTNGKKHIFMFGDSDREDPDEGYADWEVEIYPGNEQSAQDEAQEWFDNYHGFEEDEDSLIESIMINDKDKISAIVNYIYANTELPSNVSEGDVEIFNSNQLADYVFYREWEGDDSILPEVVAKLEAAYEEMVNDNDDDADKELLTEDFSPSIPVWLTNFLNSQPKIKSKLAKNFDLANMEFVKIPRNEMPSNGFHPLMKDNTKQLVYLLRDLKRNVVYLPGINGEVSLYINEDDPYRSVDAENISLKKLLQYTIILGYIDRNLESNSNKAKRDLRYSSHKGAVERGEGQHSYSYEVYPIDPETGYKDYNATPTVVKKWDMTKGQDKSGYLLNPNKYKDMLDQADMSTYGRQYERYLKKLESLRSAIIEYISNMSLNKSKGTWGSSIQYVIRYFEDAIKDFENLQKSIDDILNNSDLTDEEKNKYIQQEFNPSYHWGNIKGVRDNIEKAWKELKAIQDQERDSNITESIKPDINSPELQELAQKHNVEILSSMSNGDLRLSGTGADLMKFYQEAEKLGLWEVDPSLYECNSKINETLTMHNSDEFNTIANETGLTTDEDLENFRREEVQPGESELDAIKRYKQELIEAGIDLNSKEESIVDINNDSNNVVDVDDNGEDFIAILKNDLIPAKKELQKLQDSNASEAQIEIVKDRIKSIEEKLISLKNSQ